MNFIKNFSFQIVCILLISSSLFAQEHKEHQYKSQYISESKNDIKALTKDELEQLSKGEGMGLAKAAELNHYPGPKHVQDLSLKLNLTKGQIEKTNDIYKSMKVEAVRLGKILIKKEKGLDLLFKENKINEKLLKEKITEIAKLKGELRFVHLYAHLKERQILTSRQINIYNNLRGYN